MLFTQPPFLFFFTIVFVIFWVLKSNETRNRWLLTNSYVFYGFWDWRFLFLILASTLIDFQLGKWLYQPKLVQYRKHLLGISVIANLSILGIFKYFNFFMASGAGMLQFLGIHQEFSSVHLVLPVGISFFTFQTMSYTIDIYRRKIQPRASLLDFALYVSFFPQLVAGPIVRASDFLPQLPKAKVFNQIDFTYFLWLFLGGFIKKACIADNISAVVDQVFASPESYTTAATWLGMMLYSIQIYCDFSGYTDMAIACAGLLGFRLVRNFDGPYLATSVIDFWRRWHISLSSWLRDYLYLALGGRSSSKLKTARNVLITMLLGGLWHGAAWTFVLWGLLHGLALIVNRLYRNFAISGSTPKPVAWSITVLFVMLLWVPFRADSIVSAATYWKRLFGFSGSGNNLPSELFLLVAVLAGLHFAWQSRRNEISAWLDRLSGPHLAFAYGVAWAAVLLFLPLEAEPFIYFQF